MIPAFLLTLNLGPFFGAGLAVFRIVDRGWRRGFLDIAKRWDTKLAFVMDRALIPKDLAWQIQSKSARAITAPAFDLPAGHQLGGHLLGNPKIFEIGYAIAGLCLASTIQTRKVWFLRDGTLTAIRRHGMRKRQEWTARPPMFAQLEPGYVS